MDLQQWERILVSTNHYQRLEAEAVRKKTSEEKRIKWLQDKNISEEELLEHGYRREGSLGDVSRSSCRNSSDNYEIAMSLTGRVLCNHIYLKDKHYEEERMIDIAEHVSNQLNVNVNNIALTKVVGKERKCQVLVTVLERTPPIKRYRGSTRSPHRGTEPPAY